MKKPKSFDHVIASQRRKLITSVIQGFGEFLGLFTLQVLLKANKSYWFKIF